MTPPVHGARRAPGRRPITRLVIYLIKPSNYDEDGYVIRYWRGVLPSNTLSCLYGLTEDVRERGVLGRRLQWRVELIDETVQRVNLRGILRAGRRRGTKALVCLVGVQSNQFARAGDLALACRAAGIDVLIGGFHVSGSLAMLPGIPPEIQRLLDAGVSVVAGEIEARWEGILQDAVAGRLQPVYDFLLQPPALQAAPMPRVVPGYLRRFVAPNFGTLDCGRGCPFNCSFCTVINVQGRAMRFRDVGWILETIRANYRRGISAYFFTDDNFCRNKYWEAILDGLIRLRQDEGIRIGFMVQADTQSYKLPNFIAKARAAGCAQVFIGLESLNPQNLEAAGKRQNRIADFQALISAYREAGINTHVAYIIGFPFDTSASVTADIQRLTDELGPEQASFFMLTPLPGSRDHVELLQQGAPLDPDLNRYDSFHATTDHPRMSRREWTGAYEAAWASFYHVENMKRILRRVSAENYWSVFANFIWYKNATMVERGHPMVHGFVRLKERLVRRPGLPIETRWQYARRRLGDLRRYLVLWPRLAFEMEEVWLQTRPRSLMEQRVIGELKQIPSSVRGWRRMRASELQQAYRRAAQALRDAVPHALPCVRLAVPTRLWLWLQRWNPCAQSLTWSRASLQRFWRRSAQALKWGRLDRVDVSGLVFHGLQELALFSTFAAVFFSQLLRRLLARAGFTTEEMA
ncbi:MAG: radical SAM protein [Candidatus Omnitrophica bacterium]|nr:radical SAM protein [Candidatus Omnitrophota bacterium]